MFTLIKKDGRARRGRFVTPHGTIETPVFMNVATCGAIKGGLGADDLREVGCQVMLSNTYHLHVRPGDGLVREIGGLRQMTRWTRSRADRQRRLSGLFSVTASPYPRGGRVFFVPC